MTAYGASGTDSDVEHTVDDGQHGGFAAGLHATSTLRALLAGAAQTAYGASGTDSEDVEHTVGDSRCPGQQGYQQHGYQQSYPQETVQETKATRRRQRRRHQETASLEPYTGKPTRAMKKNANRKERKKRAWQVHAHRAPQAPTAVIHVLGSRLQCPSWKRSTAPNHGRPPREEARVASGRLHSGAVTLASTGSASSSGTQTLVPRQPDIPLSRAQRYSSRAAQQQAPQGW